MGFLFGWGFFGGDIVLGFGGGVLLLVGFLGCLVWVFVLVCFCLFLFPQNPQKAQLPAGGRWNEKTLSFFVLTPIKTI